MSITLAASGTQTAVIGTEHSLATTTTSGTYVLAVDASALANGDTLELRLKSKVLSLGTENPAYYAGYANVQATGIKYSVPIPCNIFLECTLKQTAGTGRSFPWSLLKIDS